MAKNTFLIRASVTTQADNAYDEIEIDLGSYTNLGSSKPEVLRIHRTAVFMTDSAGNIPSMATDKGGSSSWQLLTQAATAIVLPTDDSFVVGGQGGFRNPDGNDALPPTQTYETQMLAQDYENGYVVAVPTLHLGAIASANFSESVTYSVILECTTEAMSKANAVSLAISQQ